MEMQYPTEVIPQWLPPRDGCRLFQEQFVGVDDSGEVRAGYILKHQDFKLKDVVVPIADLRLPISEGSVNRDHAGAATELLFSALSKQRLLFGMGIGGYDEPVTKLFQAAGWRVVYDSILLQGASSVQLLPPDPLSKAIMASPTGFGSGSALRCGVDWISQPSIKSRKLATDSGCSGRASRRVG